MESLVWYVSWVEPPTPSLNLLLWILQIDDDFLASYQASYGINTESTATETSEKEQVWINS